jgi:hypothetical protein
MEILFTFLAERYERNSVIITSNVVFSEWDRIFKDPTAAIDRLVHHSVILEMTGPSVRAEAADRARKEGTTTTTTTPCCLVKKCYPATSSRFLPTSLAITPPPWAQTDLR